MPIARTRCRLWRWRSSTGGQLQWRQHEGPKDRRRQAPGQVGLRRHAPTPSARKDRGCANYFCRAAAHYRARRSRAWARDGQQARATASLGVGVERKARCASSHSGARREEGIQCSDEQ
jgi:hypothetical protein